MASYQSTVSLSTEPANIDLVRRYCPQMSTEMQRKLAGHLHPNAQGCWPWDGTVNENGYADIPCEPTPYGDRQSVRVHRYMFDVLVGEIPYAYHVHHRCRVKHCWNLFHLKAVTAKEHYLEHHPCATPWRPMVQLVFDFMHQSHTLIR